MLGVIIKNNLKLMLRNKAMLIVVPLGALLVVAALSNAFHTLLNKAEQVGKFTLGYEISEESSFAPFEPILVDSMEEQGITCAAYENADAPHIVETGAADVFLDIQNDGYHIYGGSKNELQARLVQYIMVQAENQMGNAVSQGETALFVQELPAIPVSNAENYYGIIEIVYFISVCGILMSPVILSERKGKLADRLHMGNAGNARLYFGKLVPCIILSVLLQVVITGGLITAIYHVKWGKPFAAFGILCLAAVAFSAMGLMFLMMSQNIAVSIVLLFAIDWWAGFFGGSFETYMYSSLPENLKSLSPVYYVNRTLVEFSTMGESSYTAPCICVLLGMTVISILLGIFMAVVRQRLKLGHVQE